MGSEIERKFVLGEPPGELAQTSPVAIEQGYLALDDEIEVRLRRIGRRRLLTVKRGAGELREEIEVVLDPEAFDLLWPLTESRRVEKRRHRIPLDGLTAEVDVYGGELSGLLVAEIEFPDRERSQRFQPPAWLGREVTEDGRYANRSLAVHGLPAIDATSNGKRHGASSSYSLKRKEPVASGLRRIAGGRASRALQRLREPADGELAEAVHGARKDMKKLRAVLRLGRGALPGKLRKAENRRYRDAARLLSRSRDAEVKLETIAALREHCGAAFPADAAVAWERGLERERDAITAGLGGGGNGEGLGRALELIEAGAARIAEWPPIEGDWELIGDGLGRSYRGGRRGLERTRSSPGPENVHEWRKRTKDLWYQLRIVQRSWPELLEPTIEQVHALADRLGDHHDLEVLREDLAGREIARRDEFANLIAKRQDELLDEALELGARLYAEKPKAFERRLRSYWKAWRQSRASPPG